MHCLFSNFWKKKFTELNFKNLFKISVVDFSRIVRAEILCAEDAREEPHSIEKLVTDLRNWGCRPYPNTKRVVRLQ